MKISVKEKMKEAEQMSLQYPDVLYRVMDKTGQRAIVKKTFADVPDRIKDKVKEVLVDLDCPELAE